ncbi:geranyllinalool synthase [Sarracenia purpurea var. burkii]
MLLRGVSTFTYGVTSNIPTWLRKWLLSNGCCQRGAVKWLLSKRLNERLDKYASKGKLAVGSPDPSTLLSCLELAALVWKLAVATALVCCNCIRRHHFPRWFAIVFPGMVEIARVAGLEVVFTKSLEAVISSISFQRQQILEMEVLVDKYHYPPLLSYLPRYELVLSLGYAVIARSIFGGTVNGGAVKWLLSKRLNEWLDKYASKGKLAVGTALVWTAVVLSKPRSGSEFGIGIEGDPCAALIEVVELHLIRAGNVVWHGVK